MIFTNISSVNGKYQKYRKYKQKKILLMCSTADNLTVW